MYSPHPSPFTLPTPHSSLLQFPSLMTTTIPTITLATSEGAGRQPWLPTVCTSLQPCSTCPSLLSTSTGSVCLPVCYLSVCLSACIPACVPAFLSVCLPARVPACLSVSLSAYLSVCLFISVHHVHMCTCVTVYRGLYVHVSTCMQAPECAALPSSLPQGLARPHLSSTC